ncbi:hypothetical protein [Corallococcus carmarthensis]|uniref:Ig-like domain-containing protein n=1 Tax=Corallococcus carmarthensis TaxID=2316728 RepID=A0A3A8JGS4_9BACT|nr:hypothetical protein [Corallococcus carmarthensis]NOK23194.1 hypothetical protein [Corallococcus carmarthensis]RKG94545.1 hypothetical protein D7X32_41840 [Corallococcus carmarthensis]
MKNEYQKSALLWLLCQAVALSACGPEADLEAVSELRAQEQGTYGADLGRRVGAGIASINTCGLANDFTPTCSPSSTAPEIAYIWTAPWTANYTFTTQGSNFDTVLEVRPYNDTTQSFGCNDDSNGTVQSSVTTHLTAGQTVYLIVDGYGASCGGAQVNISSDVHMLFGGMYGLRDNGVYVNPYTGATSCPSGYTSYQVLGSYNMDYNLYFCGRFADGATEPVAEFAGAFGWHSAGTYPNPITGGNSCPSGFLTTSTLGSYNMDYEVRYCHRQHVAGARDRYRFGGMYGFRNGGVYVNPITGTTSCPNGFTASRVLGTYNKDYEAFFCYRDIGP